MSNIINILNARKRQKSLETGDWRTIVEQVAENVATAHFEALKQALVEQVRQEVENELLQLTKRVHKGEKGEKGERGVAGPKGERGEKGDQGVPGKDGRSPRPGIDYQMPKDGKDGRDGKDGSPDTPQQVADKLNTLDEAVEMKVVKGLPVLLTNIQRALRERTTSSASGGGMGNVQHESKAVSSVTTAVTTTYRIAGNGYAIWAYYQGQLIMRGTHYTVSGNTLTLTFTPDDDTSIDIIYVRT